MLRSWSDSWLNKDRGAAYDAIWCVVMDCVMSEVVDKLEYRYVESDSMMMYVLSVG